MPVSSLQGEVTTHLDPVLANVITSQELTYAGADAQKDIKKIKSWLLADNGSLKKIGTLRLVQDIDGTYTLKRHRWYHNFCFWAPDAKKNASEFIGSLFDKAGLGDKKITDGETKHFVTYLFSQKTEVTAEQLRELISEHESYVKQGTHDGSKATTDTASSGSSANGNGAIFGTSTAQAPLLTKKYISFEKSEVTQLGNYRSSKTKFGSSLSLPESRMLKGLLETTLRRQFGVNINFKNQIGSGNFGTVYQAYGSNAESYVFKIEKEIRPIIANSTSGVDEKWWRDGDFAASRLDLRSMAKTALVVIQVNNKTGTTYHLLPPEKAKEFGQGLRKTNPETQVGVVAQLMEKAPGEELAKVLNKQGSIDPGSDDFKDLLNGCCAYIEDAHYANVIHSDIKPANLMFLNRRDAQKSVVTMIDGGFSKRGARRYVDENARTPKTESKNCNNKLELNNRRFFQRDWGTQEYKHPKVLKNYSGEKTDYGSEVNAYSVGVTLLESINPTEFHSGRYKHPSNKDSKEQAETHYNAAPETYLDRYLIALGSDSKTAQALNQHPEIKEFLQLTFQLSGDNSEESFTKWQEAFHTFQTKYSYEVKTDFTKKTKN